MSNTPPNKNSERTPPAFHCAQFLLSAPSIHECPPDHGFEVAFAGRSNAGKSSALNTLTGQTKLARVSKTPGRTQQINYFKIDDDRRIIDLPGYGYAKVAKKVREEWQHNLAQWFVERMCLTGLVLVMDVRHPLKPYDEEMLDLCADRQLPVHILLTKSDKFSQSQASKSLNAVRKEVQSAPFPISVQLFSSLKNRGIPQLENTLKDWLKVGVDLNA